MFGMVEDKNSILCKPITELPLSSEFKVMASVNEFSTLADLLIVPHYSIHALPKSGYRIVKELLMLLEREKLLELIDDN